MGGGVETQSISNLRLTLAPTVDNAGHLWRAIDSPDEQSSERTVLLPNNRTRPVGAPTHSRPGSGPCRVGRHEYAAQRVVAGHIFQDHHEGL